MLDKRNIFISKDKGTPRKILTDLVKLPPVDYNDLTLLNLLIPPQLPTLHPTEHKIHRSVLGENLHLLMKAAISHKTYIK